MSRYRSARTANPPAACTATLEVPATVNPASGVIDREHTLTRARAAERQVPVRVHLRIVRPPERTGVVILDG